MNKIKFLTIAVISTLFFSSTSTYAMKNNENSINTDKSNEQNENSININTNEQNGNSININTNEQNGNSININTNEYETLLDENDEIFDDMCVTFRQLMYALESYTFEILPYYTMRYRGEMVFTPHKVDTESTIKGIIDNVFLNNEFLYQIEMNFEDAYNEYKDQCSKTINDSEKEKFKEKYIEQCNEEINRIRNEIIEMILNGRRRYDDFYTEKNDNFISEGNYYECRKLNHIEKLIEDMKKNKEMYEKFYTKYKNTGEITDEIKEQIIVNFKNMVQDLQKQDTGPAILTRKHGIHTLSAIVEDLKSAEEERKHEYRINNKFLPTPKEILYKKDEEILKELSKKVQEMLTENNRIINTQNDDISHEDILNYYDKLINLGKKIHEYTKIFSIKVSQKNYESIFLLHSKSWMDKRIKENLKKNLHKDIISSIPKSIW